MKRHAWFPLLPILLILSSFLPAAAQGLYIEPDASSREALLKSTAHPALSLTKRHLCAEIVDAGATVVLTETFHNKSRSVLEGTYVFPVPPGTAATGLSLSINGVEAASEMLDSGRARQIYRDIVRKARDPGLLEYVGHGLLRASVFPIQPQSDVTVTLRFVAAVEQSSSQCHFSFPLRTSVRGEPDVVIETAIRSERAIRNIYSPSHGVDVVQENDRAARVTHEGRHRENRNFSLYYSLSNDEYGFSLLTHATPAGENFFLFMLAPKLARDPEKVIPKDVVFVIDKSGSMKGEKWDQAREALKYCVNRLNREDRFAILAFSSEVCSFHAGLVKAGKETKSTAAAFVDSLAADGGTDLHGALVQALDRLSGSPRLSMVALLTDGLPSVGVKDPQQILSDVAQKNKKKLRIFNFGVGYDVNTHLLDSIARTTKGATDYIAPEENIEIKVSSYFSRISDPVLTDVALAFEGVETFDVYPRPMEDVFAGSSLVAVGRFERGGAGEGSPAPEGKQQVIVTGSVGDTPVRYAFDAEFGKTSSADFLPTYWAMRKIGYLLNAIRLNGLSEELEEEVIALGKRYSIVTHYTSALVIEDEQRLARATGQPADSVPAIAGSSGFLTGRGRARENLRRLAGETQPPQQGTGRGAATPTGASGYPAGRAKKSGGSKPKASGPSGPSTPGSSSGTLSRRHRLSHRRKPTASPGKAPSANAGGGTMPGPSGATRPSPGSPTGKKSVEQAKKLGRMERFGNLPSGVTPDDSKKGKTPKVVHVGTLGFLEVGGCLVDTRFEEKMRSKIIRIETFSDAYFALFETGDEVKKILALGERIIFLLGEKVYEIHPEDD